MGNNARRDGASLIPQSKYLRCAAALTVTVTLAVSVAPASAKSRGRHAPGPQAAAPVNKEPFGNVPKGPVQIFVSIDQQKLHLYSDGVHVADTSVATGVPSLPTPLGVFSVIQKQVFHRSNLYSNAPMPFMQRITWSGVALHEGESIGHRASHGCIRMPRDFAMRLYGLTRIGARVIVADQELKPAEFADPHLFVHKDKPPEPAAAPVASDAPKTAENADISKTTDAAPADTAAPLQPTALGLRVSTAAAVATPVGATPVSATPVSATSDTAALPPPGKPADVVKAAPVKKTPIAIFISRKEKKIFVRQDFEPLFDSAVTIDQPDRPLGTHLFTAMDLLDDHAAFRWTVVSLPGDPPKPVRNAENEKRPAKHARDDRRDDGSAKTLDIPPPPQTPAEALARIAIPQDAIDRISALMVQGSSLIVSDQGIGDETGEGTDFIVVTR